MRKLKRSVTTFATLSRFGFSFLHDIARMRFGLRPRKPFVVVVTLNTVCNLRCSYCFISQESEHFPEGFAKQGLPTEQVKKMLANIRKDSALLIITGGEPFLHRDFEEILRYAKETLNFVNISVASNGILLQKKRNCLYYIDRLGISYDLTRASEYPEEMERMLLSLVHLKKEKVLPPLHFTMTLLQSQDLSQLDSFFSYCKTNGYRVWLQPVRDHGNFTEWNWFVEAVRQIASRYGQELLLNDLSVIDTFGSTSAMKLCMPELRLHVMEDGNLCYPCVKLEHLHKRESVLTKTPMEIWHSDMKKWRAYPNELCGKCGFTCYFETTGLYSHPFNFIRKAVHHLSGGT